MFGLVIPALIATWQVSNSEAGLVGGVTLVTSAIGGWLGGALSDRIGRVRALQVTVLWYICSAKDFLTAYKWLIRNQILKTGVKVGF
jgi:MFS family permease